MCVLCVCVCVCGRGRGCMFVSQINQAKHVSLSKAIELVVLVWVGVLLCDLVCGSTRDKERRPWC